MEIVKRNGESVTYEDIKIKNAVERSFISVNKYYNNDILEDIVMLVKKEVFSKDTISTVEKVQDTVELTLMQKGFYEVAKSYILYREKHSMQREQRKSIVSSFPNIPHLNNELIKIQKDFGAECPIEFLANKFLSFKKEGMSEKELLNVLIKATVELTSQEKPMWEFVGSRLLLLQFKIKVKKYEKDHNINSFYEKVCHLTKAGLYGKYILESYTKEELEECEKNIMTTEYNKLFNYSGLDLILKRYVIRSFDGVPLETPEEMFLGISLHLAIEEKNDRLNWVKRFYYMLSTLKVTMATPTLSNARKPFYQLSSCFIDTVPDSLNGIFRSIDNFAKVSKFGGGMGMYFGKVRSKGSDIRGFKGVAGGVIRWIKLVNDTAVAVDQLGMRHGAVAVYLDAWHRDLPEFLSIRTNNGDDRMKAHDVFPAICYPNKFWEQAEKNIDSNWYLMCPHEISTNRGYSLEDFYGKEWEIKYKECINDPRIEKRVIPIKEIIRLIIKSSVETGTPFIFNRDIVNEYNPNPHKGIIYCSNLCTEIAQNTSGISTKEKFITTKDGETVVVNETIPGDFVVCNLGSLSLGRINVEDKKELQHIVESCVRALDNVISMNFFPVEYAEITNNLYRPIGLGVSGYHHMLAKNKISWESEKHINFVDELFEDINYYAISASCKNAIEKGSYDYFEGSDWHNGNYFTKRNYTSNRWIDLAKMVKENGIRNAYLLAIAPTSSTSIITGTTAGIDPIMNKFYLEEKKNSLLPRVAPELSLETMWYYKNAHLINQNYSIKACGVRQRHIDQAQSMNIYITTDYTFRQILDLYITAYKEGVKTIYYIRNKSLEIDDCESCSS